MNSFKEIKNIKIKGNLYDDGNHKFYDRSEIITSKLGDKIIIGSESIVQNSFLKSNISINRRNFIHRANIGSFTYTGINTFIRSCEIGSFCSISWNVSIGGGEHPKDRITNCTTSRFHMLDSGHWNKSSNIALEKTYIKQKPCTVGNDVLISSNAVILRDVKIGNGAVIGAGAVVTKDVEPYAIVAGVPAKKIKMRFDDKTIEALEELQWWNWPVEIIRENLDLIYSTKVNEQVLEQLREIKSKIR